MTTPTKSAKPCKPSKPKPGKIQIGDTLASKTLAYWQVSTAFNGHDVNVSVDVGVACRVSRELSEFLGGHRKLKRHTMALNAELIKNGAKREKHPETSATVLQLRNTAS